MFTPDTCNRAKRLARSALLLAAAVWLPAQAQSVDLADKPLFSTTNVPGNLILALSVEWPTASTPAYLSTVAYSAANTYLGYFDPEKCYRYDYNAVTPTDSYFSPVGAATAHACTTAAATPRWSGNYLNWASTQTLDTFRWVLTGGPRSRTATLDGDTAALTILEKTRHSGQGSRSSVYPDKILGSGVSGATPFTWSGAVSRVHGLGSAIHFSAMPECTFSTNGSRRTTFDCRNAGTTLTCNTGDNNPASGGSATCTAGTAPTNLSCTVSRPANNTYNYSCTVGTSAACTAGPATYSSSVANGNCSPGSGATLVDYSGQNSAAGTAATNTYYRAYVRVKACDSAVGVEGNCKQYGSNYKPEGLMQKYAMQLRYSAFGYLNHSVGSGAQRDGAVMRARMKSIGPSVPVPGAPSTTNTLTEWNASTGVMHDNPDSADASATASNALTEGGYSVTVNNSGVMNYLNKFGKNPGDCSSGGSLGQYCYKGNDPASELYYSAQRYLRNLGNVTEYTNLAGSGSATELNKWVDGFPVIKNWTDPIQYSCQKNFILGIGDVYTHRDANLPGSTMPADSLEPSVPAQVSADTTVNVKTATDMVGQLEGLNGTTVLGLQRTGSGGGTAATYFITGLAYDAHSKDIRADIADKQTISTYWLDVMETQTYVSRNQYWLAAKYGGFDVPSTFDPYAGTNGTSTLTQPMWSTTGETVGSDPRPDNYFVGDNAAAMALGLNRAFAKIVSENDAASSTAFSTTTAKVSTLGTASYAANYDPRNWSGELSASQITFDASGNPTLVSKWSARDLLDAKAPSTRKIVTCCTSTGAALPFTSADLGAATLHSRTYYASFSNVPGASSQSAANFVSYLRGDRTKELANGGAYRTRAHVLGDIVGSKANPVGPPNAPYLELRNPGYSLFRQTYANRKTVVYVGANDGMMHAFDGALPGAGPCASCGTELFAYVPSFVYGDASTASTLGLASLGNPSFAHHALVDATPLAFDLDFKNTVGSTATTNEWRTIVIGGLGKGGKGYYAIDVTDPTSWATESAVAGKVLWEFTDSRMGHSFGDASVVKTKKYGWVAILKSGYNNSDGKGYLFLVNPRTGALLEAIETPEGSVAAPLNLAHHAAFIPDYADFTADAVYAGDLRGNVWRFELTAASGAYPAPLKVAVLTDAGGVAQPVTTRPLVEIEPNSNKRYIVIGTGRLLADSDIASTQLQSIYAIIDGTGLTGGFYTSATLPAGVAFPVGRSNLNANTALLSGIGSTPTNPMGWYVDLGAAVSGGIAERVNVTATANTGIIAMGINLPNGAACNPAGTGRVVALTLAEGKSVLVDSAGAPVATYASTGVIRDVALLNVGGKTRLLVGDSKGQVSNAGASPPATLSFKRLNWREVPTAN